MQITFKLDPKLAPVLERALVDLNKNRDAMSTLNAPEWAERVCLAALDPWIEKVKQEKLAEYAAALEEDTKQLKKKK